METESEAKADRDRQVDRQTGRKTDRQTYRQANRQTDRQTWVRRLNYVDKILCKYQIHHYFVLPTFRKVRLSAYVHT